MPFTVTVHLPRRRARSVDVVVDPPAGRAATGRELREALEALLGEPVPALVVADAVVTDDAAVGAPPLLHGAEIVLATTDRSAGARSAAGTPLDVVVTSGPDAGRRVPLPPTGLVVGRGAGADLVLDDPDLSRRHLLIDVTRRRRRRRGPRLGQRHEHRGTRRHRSRPAARRGPASDRVEHPRPASRCAGPAADGTRRPRPPRRASGTPGPRTEPGSLGRGAGRADGVAPDAPALGRRARPAARRTDPRHHPRTALPPPRRRRAGAGPHDRARRPGRVPALRAAGARGIHRRPRPRPSRPLGRPRRGGPRTTRRAPRPRRGARRGQWTRVTAVGAVPRRPGRARGAAGARRAAGPDGVDRPEPRPRAPRCRRPPRRRRPRPGGCTRGRRCARRRRRRRAGDRRPTGDGRLTPRPAHRGTDGWRGLGLGRTATPLVGLGRRRALCDNRIRDRTDPGCFSWSTSRAVGSRRPGSSTLERTPDARTVALVLAADEATLPAGCGAVLEVAPRDESRLRVDGVADIGGIVVDRPRWWWSARLSRALAPLCDARIDPEAREGPPDEVRLLDVLPFDATDPTAVRARWEAADGPVAVVGATREGPWWLDLRRDGPHAPRRRDDRVRQVRAPPVARRLARGPLPAGGPLLRARRLQGWVGVRRLRGPPPRRRPRHRPRRASRRPRPDVAACRADPTRAGPRDARRPGPRGLPRPPPAGPARRRPPRHRRRRAAGPRRGAARVRRRDRPHRRRGTLPRGPPRPRHPAPERGRLARDPRQRQPPGRSARSGPERLPRRHRPARCRLHPRRPPGTRTGPDRRGPADLVPGRPRLGAASGRRARPARRPARRGRPRTHCGGEPRERPGPRHSSGHRRPTSTASSARRAPRSTAGTHQRRIAPGPPRYHPGCRRRTPTSTTRPSSWGWPTTPASSARSPCAGPLSVATGSSRADPAPGGPLPPWPSRRRRPPAGARTSCTSMRSPPAASPPSPTLPQAGTVLGLDDPERLDRLITRLTDEVRRRSASQEATPALLLLVDGWERIAAAELLGGTVGDRLAALVRDGAAVGLSAVVTGDRSLLLGRTAALMSETFLLRLADPVDAALVGLDRSAVPADPPPGRAVRARDGVEVQLVAPPTTRPTGSRSGRSRPAARCGSRRSPRCSPRRVPERHHRGRWGEAATTRRGSSSTRGSRAGSSSSPGRGGRGERARWCGSRRPPSTRGVGSRSSRPAGSCRRVPRPRPASSSPPPTTSRPSSPPAGPTPTSSSSPTTRTASPARRSSRFSRRSPPSSTATTASSSSRPRRPPSSARSGASSSRPPDGTAACSSRPPVRATGPPSAWAWLAGCPPGRAAASSRPEGRP